jgi:hypothetical protein
MKMFRWGHRRRAPGQGSIGIAPEWFYKGADRTCGLTANPWKFRLTPKTAEKKPKSPAFT